VESGRVACLRFEDLDLAATLSSGQVFRWKRDADGAWRGTLGRRRVRLAQDADGALCWAADGPGAGAAVRAFLRLDDFDLSGAAETWCGRDPLFAAAWARQPGIRVLRQEPDECFFSFLCASVAPIARIAAMLGAVAARYGEPLGNDDNGAGASWRAFPDATRLAAADEATLRALGLGFRARRVAAAAREIASLPAGWLGALRAEPYGAAKQTLLAFFGVGEKIADCVCLFALDKDAAIPVDTHIWRLAQTCYAPELRGRSLTAAAYARVGEAFRERFGPHAGWAQQTLFYRAAVARD
jgi:N-glycosylase/DNA lyase